MDFLKVVPGNSLQEQSLHVPQKKAEQPDDAIYILRDHTSSFRECFLSDFKSGCCYTTYRAADPFFLSELAILDQTLHSVRSCVGRQGKEGRKKW